MTLEDQLQDAYQRAAQRAPVSPGAYDRFLRRRARHGRVVAATTGPRWSPCWGRPCW